MAKKLDPAVVAHQEWIGFVQPTGLVVSAHALVRAGAILDRRDAEGQRLLRAYVEERTFDPAEGPAPYLPDFEAFVRTVLGWSFSAKGYAGTDENPIPPELELPLPDYGETLRPDFAVRELDPRDDGSGWQLLVRVLEPGEDFDKPVRGSGRLEASPHGRMERLLRHTCVPAGLLFNGRALRLLSAPRGESSGWLDLKAADMVQTAGRPISTALRLLLGQSRLLALPRAQRLAALLEDSRKYQNEVSERLAEQVLHALYEFIRGFQAAHDASKGDLLHEPLSDRPDEVYRALLTVILRLVFLLFAEERDMLPSDEVYLQHYSLAGLYERLREDAALFPDTMDQRFGAWGRLLVLFRMIHDGADAGEMRIPKRHGALFDPDRFPFLEGRGAEEVRQVGERIEPPLVPDGTVYRALEKLLVLEGERISYRALDVEEIGSVYQGMMGFRLETATGRSLAVKASKKWAAPTTIDLDQLLETPAGKRTKWLQDQADRRFGDAILKAVRASETLGDLHAAFEPVVDRGATPDLVPEGAMVLQPSEERRRSGSHYTPRSLTEPIVRTTLEPILARLRGSDRRVPRPEQILDLKVCDPAMGSGAFLVEACRQLGDALIEAWHAHDEVPSIPPDEDEVVFARRLVAQRCIYGVDRNPVAVDLAKMSLWLMTLAREHPLTFVDHALRHGDSLVGLTLKQIEAFHWDPEAQRFDSELSQRIRNQLEKASTLRRRIREADETVSDWELHDLWDEARAELATVRLWGDLVLAAFFGEDKPRKREDRRSEYVRAIVTGEAERYRTWLEAWRYDDPPLAPFHWEIEFPEVFERLTPGFDAFVGNPPFAHKNVIVDVGGPSYIQFFQSQYAKFHGYSDLSAYFIRVCSRMTRNGGVWTLVCTNTVAQGKSRDSGLRQVVDSGFVIIAAVTNRLWPGEATVFICAPTLFRGEWGHEIILNNRVVKSISTSLDDAADGEIARLTHNRALSTTGFLIYGSGFIVDTLSAEEMFFDDSMNRQVVQPLLSASEITEDPRPKPNSFVVNFGSMSEEEAKRFARPFKWVEDHAKASRLSASRTDARKNWWRLVGRADRFYSTARDLGLSRFLVNVRISAYLVFWFSKMDWAFESDVNAFAVDSYSAFGILQSQIHQRWAAKRGSTLGLAPRYTPTSCFDTFPFPDCIDTYPGLEAAGQTYYEFRAALMDRNDEGLTKTYNRFHNPEERDPEIEKLRELRAAMDRAVLDAYEWTDIPTDCEFLLDYEIDEEEWGNKKKPWRYRWPDEIRDKVLARLLRLNAERAEEEKRAGAAAEGGGSGRSASRMVAEPSVLPFGYDDEEDD